MTRWGLAALTVLAAAAFAGGAAAADPAACRFAPAAAGQASNALERLVALTSEQRGLGGTGVVAQREERGLGGTGISKTGIIGVVTGFGSICVNGFEVQMTAATAVTVEGLPGNDGDIHLGQVVEVEALTGANGLTAARVDVGVAVAGPVSAIAPDRTQMTVAGQTVAVENFAGSADITNVRRGDWVVVSGLRRADDSIAGTSVVRLAQRGREVFVSGTARSAAGRVEIGGLAITAASAAAQVTPGATVAVRGTLSGDTLRASAVQTAGGFSQAMTNVSVQAYGPQVAAELRRLGINGAPPVTAATPVQIDGSLDATGTLTPQRVEPAAPPAVRPAMSAPVAPAVPTVRPDQSAPSGSPAAPVRPGDPPPRPTDRPVIPDVARPVVPERIAPPQRPERPPPPPDRPQRPGG